jgi:hypothetical protein
LCHHDCYASKILKTFSLSKGRGLAHWNVVHELPESLLEVCVELLRLRIRSKIKILKKKVDVDIKYAHDMARSLNKTKTKIINMASKVKKP